MSSKLQKPRAKLKDIAHSLGVSPATISNAYHHPDHLSAKLRARIFEAAEHLGYLPNPTARGLRMQTTKTVGVVYSHALPCAFTDPAFSMFLQGVAEITQHAGLKLLLLSGAEGPVQDTEAVRNAAVDGFVFYAPGDHDPRIKVVETRQLPAILVDAELHHGLPVVSIDDEGGAFALGDHIFGLGHRNVCVLCSDQPLGFVPSQRHGQAEFVPNRDRIAGYIAAANHHGLNWDTAVNLFFSPENNVEHGRLAARTILTTVNRPTALLCLSDQLALGSLAAARDLGLSVPDDLSVVGFDDTPESARTTPPLTTVHQSHAGKGRAAMTLLLNLFTETNVTSRRLPTNLVLRQSTAPPPRMDRALAKISPSLGSNPE